MRESGGKLRLEELYGEEWRAVGSAIRARSCHSCTALEGKLYVVGGLTGGYR